MKIFPLKIHKEEVFSTVKKPANWENRRNRFQYTAKSYKSLSFITINNMNKIWLKIGFPQHDLFHHIRSPQLIEQSHLVRRNSLELSYLNPKREESSLTPSEIEKTGNTYKMSSIEYDCANLFNCQEVKGKDFNPLEEDMKPDRYPEVPTPKFASAMARLGNKLKSCFYTLLYLFILYGYSQFNNVLYSSDRQF